MYIRTKETMYNVWYCAELEPRPLVFGNLAALHRYVLNLSGSNTIWHGRPDMDSYRLKPVRGYSGIRTACNRDQNDQVPFFWIDQGAVHRFTVTKYPVIRGTKKPGHV